jgi:predicted membrane protein
MGLLIAFTFSGALTRFDVRRAQVVDEANAVGTAYLRLDLLPASVQPRLRDAMREYVDARIATYGKLPDLAGARQEIAHSQRMQSEVWAQAVAAMRLPEVRPGTEFLLMSALNQMFDMATVRLVATQIHPPNVVYSMLIALALAAAMLSGYQTAGGRTRDWMHQIGFAAIIALTVYVIFDIEYPRLGFVRIDAIDQVLIDARAGMK